MPGGEVSRIWCSMVAPHVEASRTLARNHVEVLPERVANRSHWVLPPQTNPQLRSPEYEPTRVAVPHAFGEARWLSSQPLTVFESQSSNPELQLWMAHEPVPQVAVALAREQVVPQLPQCARVVSVCSQPFVPFPSQLPQPELQLWMAQEPVLQVALAFAREQLVPHAPQWVSVVRVCSQPLVVFPSQSPQPALQVLI